LSLTCSFEYFFALPIIHSTHNEKRHIRKDKNNAKDGAKKEFNEKNGFGKY
jgi:hypothetical protein